jgi:drug/metabolite transporter (DMT)-like permease
MHGGGRGNIGVWLAFASALGYCACNVATRLAVGEITVWGILFTRGVFGVAAMFLAARLLRKSLFGRNLGLLTCIGIAGSLSTACIVTAIMSIPLYQALVLLYLYPALTVPLGFVVNGERVRPADGMMVLLAFTGSLLLIWPDKSAGLIFGTGHLVGVGGALLYAVAYVLIRRLGEGNSGLEPMFHYSLWAMIGVSCGIAFLDLDAGLPDARAWSIGMGLATLSLVALFAGYLALRWLAPHRVGVIGTLEVFGGVLSSWLIFADPITVRALCGGVLVLFAALRLRQS